jgi:serine/alanine adding enzyme
MIRPLGAPVSVQVDDLKESESTLWDEYADAHPDGTIYHRLAWRQVMAHGFGHHVRLRVARSRTDGIVGILPIVAFRSRVFGRFLVSMPFLNGGGILASDPDSEAALREDTARLVAATGSDWCELRHLAPAGQPISVNKVELSLTVPADEESLWRGLRAKVRNQVRKAQRAGLVATSTRNPHGTKQFYAIFAENMRNLGTPVYSPRFFEAVESELGANLMLTLVSRGDEYVAGGLSLIYRDTVELHWAASRRAALPDAPNMLLYWEVLRQAVQLGAGRVSFGRSTPNSGPYHFKTQWGATPRPLAWELFSGATGAKSVDPTRSSLSAASAVWKALPLAVATRAGPVIARHLP